MNLCSTASVEAMMTVISQMSQLLLSKDFQQYAPYASEILTQSVHIPACCGDGHTHRQGIHLLSWNAAIKNVYLVKSISKDAI